MTNKIMLVKPEYFEVSYSINPWMNLDSTVSYKLAYSQWEQLLKQLESHNLEINVISGQKGLPDMTFAANAGMVHSGKAIVSSFRDSERRGEEKYFQEWFSSQSFEVKTLSRKCVWEGQACSVWLGDKLICSYSKRGGRANRKAYDEILSYWKVKEVKYIELLDPYFYHLDVSFAVINAETAMLCPMAFKRKDIAWFQKQIPNIIWVNYADALEFGCNSFVTENNIFVSASISPNLVNQLEECNLNVIKCNVSEFIKAGGGVKCLIFNY